MSGPGAPDGAAGGGALPAGWRPGDPVDPFDPEAVRAAFEAEAETPPFEAAAVSEVEAFRAVLDADTAWREALRGWLAAREGGDGAALEAFGERERAAWLRACAARGEWRGRLDWLIRLAEMRARP